ncbi:nitroreductase family protein-like protein [Zopfia rhizophila CBS 207.26]|uniref:Nitroreductase family protein-like protein n=1 Tax=Zopfia rhizophila CBS 207.26 TaxID=1314779 RepID=A0A6A6EBY4_9PEZI|nr:nitroreductase family protein-like protein [Zopfia rhizophila CBS 207.26]
MAERFLTQIKSRRTCYSVERKSPISEARILEIARDIIKHTPSSFNCQSTRFIILLRDEHAGYGTVLLYEDLDVIRGYQVRFPRFKRHLPDFSEHNNAMQAFNLWTALQLEGFGCNLQHVNPIVDQRIVSEWNVSPDWSLKAQLVFGSPTGEPNHQKTFTPTEDRIFVHDMDGEMAKSSGAQ